MVRTIKTTAFLLLAMVLMISSVSVASAETTTVDLYDVQYRMVGTASMTPMEDGTTEVTVQVNGMAPSGGDRRLAITEVGYCDPMGDFSTAGDDTQALPNVQFYASGSADSKFVVDDVDVAALADANGSALVIYADTGDEPGARIICGVIAAGPAPEAPAEEAPAEETPAEAATPVAETPAEETPAEEAPAEETPAEEATERTFEDALNEGYGVILRDVQGRDVGFGFMLESNDGEGIVSFFVEGMEAVGGNRRVALTSTNVCEGPDFASAGDEVTALPDVQFYSSGSADYGQVLADLDVSTLNDADGSAMVIYADTGEEPGARIICGSVITAEAMLNYLGTNVEDFAAVVTFLALGG
jgi:Cu/Zn superoxide dismutase